MSYNQTLTLKDRIQFYRKDFGKYPASVPICPSGLDDTDLVYAGKDDRVYGIWIMGNDYRTKSELYGAYPAGYLTRAKSFFPDAKDILHLFSGSLPPGDYVRLDLNPERSPDIVGNAETMSELFQPDSFDLILADPPYSEEDCVHYGTCMVNRNKVVKEAFKILRPGGYLVWLDQVHPMYRKDQLSPDGFIGMVKSTNHRYRCVVFFRKLNS